MTIKFFRKNVYGNETYYVENEIVAAAIRALTGKVTINKHDMKALTFLGHSLEEVLAPQAAIA